MDSTGTRRRDRSGIADLARSQDQVVTRRQLTDHGFRSRDVTQMVNDGIWKPYGHRVVVLTSERLSARQSYRAALLHAGPQARLAGLTALELEGLAGWSRDGLDLVVPSSTHVTRLPGLRVHRTSRLSHDDCLEADGLAATTPPRSALDAARWDRSGRTAAALVIAVVQQRLCTPDELDDALRRFLNVKQKVAITRSVTDSREGAESSAEVDAAELLVRAGFPRPRRQVEIETSRGDRRVDLATDLGDGRLLVVEVDGPHHDDPEVRLIDAVKDAAVVAMGGYPHHVRAEDVHQHPDHVLQEFRELHRRLLGTRPEPRQAWRET